MRFMCNPRLSKGRISTKTGWASEKMISPTQSGLDKDVGSILEDI
jgi:hypothetical protein